MARKRQSKTRIIEKDRLYDSLIVNKMITAIMKDGKKSVAEKQVYNCLEIVKKDNKDADVITLLEQALDNIRPKVEVRPRRIGGAVYQVPTIVRGNRQNSLALRWLVNAARNLPNKQYHTFSEKLASEIISALKNEGSAVTKRLEVERMADANKAFAHLKW